MSGQASAEASSTSSSIDETSTVYSKHSLSRLPDEHADRIMRVNTDGLANDQVPIEQIIDIAKDVPESLLREVFYELTKTFSTRCTTKSNAATKSTAIDTVISAVNYYFIRKYRLKHHYQFDIAKGKDVELIFRAVPMSLEPDEKRVSNISVKGRLDYEVTTSANLTDAKTFSCLVVEAKSDTPINGLVQCGLLLKRREHTQGDVTRVSREGFK